MSLPQWLNDTEREAWLTLVSIMFTLPGEVEGQLERDERLSLAEYMVLAMLSEAEGGQRRMSDLAYVTNTSQSRLSRIVARLQRDGLVERTGRTGDRRVVIASITDAGRQRVEKASPGHVQRVRETVFDHLSEDQVSHLAAVGRALFDVPRDRSSKSQEG